MPKINTVDPDLKNYYEHTELSIQLSLDGFSFCIVSEPDKKLRAIRSYTFKDVVLQEDLISEAAKILERDELLRLPHNRAKIIVYNRKSTLVPVEFCKEEYLKRILQFNHPIDDLDEIHSRSVQDCNSYMVFVVPTYIASLFSDKFKNCKFYNQAVPFLNQVLKKHENETAIYLQLNHDFFDVAVVVEGELKLYNSFLYVSDTDLIYYILYVCKQVQLNPAFIRLFYMGEKSAEKKIVKAITHYLPNAKAAFPNCERLETMPIRLSEPYCYSSLINMAICEL